VIAKITLTRQQRILDPYIRTSWNFKKAKLGSFTDMLEINLHQERIDFLQHPDKLVKLLIALLLIALKLAFQEEERRDTNVSGPTNSKLSRINEST